MAPTATLCHLLTEAEDFRRLTVRRQHLSMEAGVHLVVAGVCLPDKSVEARFGHVPCTNIRPEFVKGDPRISQLARPHQSNEGHHGANREDSPGTPDSRHA